MVVDIIVGLGITIVEVGFGVGVGDCSAEQASRGKTTIGTSTRFFILVKRRLLIYSLHGDEVFQIFLTSPWILFIIRRTPSEYRTSVLESE
jgi:hypothetical protein